MEECTVPLSDFLLADFLAAYAEFYQRWSASDGDGSAAVCLLDNLGDTAMRSTEDRHLRTQLVERGRLVFFPFHEPVTGDEAKCLEAWVCLDHEDNPQLHIGVSAATVTRPLAFRRLPPNWPTDLSAHDDLGERRAPRWADCQTYRRDALDRVGRSCRKACMCVSVHTR
jgi:hypothetical protein